MRRRDRHIFILLIAVLLAVFGFHPLEDPDIGWHLAGGLWMLDHGALPQSDPFGAEGSVWIAYSWTAELLFAAVFRLAGFEGLRILQLLMVFVAGFASFQMLLSRARRTLGNEAELGKAFIAATLSTLLLLIFLAPMFHLRPQLLSVALTALLLRWIEEKRLGSLRVALLTIVWANLHVFWVFIPLFVLTAEISREKRIALAGLSLAAGLVSPYGFQNIKALFTYAFSHDEAYQLIDEFLPLSPVLGVIFFAFLGSLIFIGRETKMAVCSPSKRVELSLALLFTAAAIAQRKYLPFYGLLWSRYFCDWLIEKIPELDTEVSQSRSAVTFGAILLLLLALITLDRQPAIPPDQAELLRIVSRLSGEEGRQLIFQSFDDGGWLAFGLYQEQLQDRLKTLVDGRTLVMGPKRLREYANVIERKSDPCELAKKWGATVAIVRRSSFLSESLQRSCQPQWVRIHEGSIYNLLKRGEGSLKNSLQPASH